MYRAKNNLMTRWRGLSTDEKPAIADHGSYFHEMDTGKEYLFDQTGGTWNEVPAALAEHTVSGDIVSIMSDAARPVKELLVGIAPVQDLHGQDAPYPPGGGKNLLNNTAETTTHNGVTFTVNADGTVYTSGTASGTAVLKIWQTFSESTSDVIINGCPAGGNYNTGYSIIAAEASGVPVSEGIDTGNGMTIAAANVSRIAQVQIIARTGTNMNGLVFKPMIRLASVTDSTFAPYSNICPITGWTGVNVERTGVNVWDEEWESGRYNDTTGAKEANGGFIRSKNFIQCKGDTQYYFKNTNDANSYQVLFYDESKAFLSKAGSATASRTITTPEDCEYMTFWVYRTTYNNDISINYPSTATAYEPYRGEEHSISWESEAGTVYGGTLNVTTGELVVDRAMVDLGDLTWNAQGSIGRFYSQSLRTDIKKGSASEGYDNAISSAFAAANVASMAGLPDGGLSVDSNGNMQLYCSAYAGQSGADFRTAMSGVQLCYELATPATYQLTPEEVTLLLGQNNIWADSGEVTVTYITKRKGVRR